MQTAVKAKLSVMMFLEFFIWGGWFVTMGTFMAQRFGASGAETGMAYETQSIGAIIAPFIIGLIADRYFSAQKILGVLHLVGAFMMYMASVAEDFSSFYPFILGYMIIYMPTLALVNSVAFRQMSDPTKEFGFIRVLGTIGWIAAGLVISFLGWESSQALANTFLMTAICSGILGVYSFFLPDTPPSGKGQKAAGISEILGLDALALLKDRQFAVFFVSSILICIPLAFYYQNANLFLNEIGVANAAGKMTLGQVSEVLFMLLIPVFLGKFGIKKTLIVGMLAWVLRYVLFAFGDADGKFFMLLLGIILHGICYDFFFVSGQIYTDFKAGPKVKSAAQGLITLATYGLGMLIGFRLAGKVTDMNSLEPGSHDWQQIWIVPAGIAVLVLLGFILSFKEEKITEKAS